MLTMTSGSATHAGKVRTSNEDNLLVSDHFVAVADGLGGHAAGEVASQIAVDRLRQLDELAHHVDAVRPDDVVAAIADANALIIDEMRRDAEHEGMGTTVTGLGIVALGGSEHVAVFNVGDSRVYRHVGSELEQLTVDHSLGQELVDRGQLRPEDLRTFAERNVITRAIGAADSTADSWLMPVTTGERLLLCSDGLYSEVPDEAIRATLTMSGRPASAAGALVDLAKRGGGRDNITVIVLDVLAGGGSLSADVATDMIPLPAQDPSADDTTLPVHA
jgi:PPM family protein phosphatase